MIEKLGLYFLIGSISCFAIKSNKTPFIRASIQNEQSTRDTLYYDAHTYICDSSIFVGLNRNLKILTDPLPEGISNCIDSIAELYFKNECKNYKLESDSFFLKSQNHYLIPNSNEILILSGYSFIQEKNEEESANIYIMSAFNHGQLVWHEINASLIGYIRMDLFGANIDNGIYKIFGEMHPFFVFDSIGYGKFICTGRGNNFKYQFECYEKQ
jgi:hypothetical protein